jgi:predicted Zn-dependent protease
MVDITMRFKLFDLRLGFLASLGVLVISGCSTPPVPPKKNDLEQVVRQSKLRQKLAHTFEHDFKFIKEPMLERYFRELGDALLKATPELNTFPIQVRVFRQKKSQKWRNYSLPGNRIYLSLDLLRTYEFENEFAAAVALELGHLQGKEILAMQEGISENEYFKRLRLFDSTMEDEVAALRNAIGILYRAGYDSRGIVTLYQKMKENSGKVFLDKGWIGELIEESRRWIATASPLRNPIVQSGKFLDVRQRIRGL